MNLIRFNQHPAFWNLLNDFDKNLNHSTNRNDLSSPLVNVINQDNQYVIEVAAPGIKKENFNIKLENNKLVISSNLKEDKDEKNVNYSIKEFGFTSFSKTFFVPKDIEAEKINADYNNGVLSVSIPKKEKEAALSRNIKVK
ncbi:MAG: heat-shock protein Hsp20 [Marinilabiliales bacterium]|nr:MAG: heat-shock protein Hsp20 [Marinilabiliales bacterium]